MPQCRVCGFIFHTTDTRQKECGRYCARILASINRSDINQEQKIELARAKYQQIMSEEYPFQDFCFGRRILFR